MRYSMKQFITLFVYVMFSIQGIYSIDLLAPIKWYGQKRKHDKAEVEDQRKIQQAFENAVERGNYQQVEYFLKHHNVVLNQPPQTLTRKFMNILLDIDEPSKLPTILFYALAYPDIVSLLIAHGADVHAVWYDDHTPLHAACKSRYTDTIKILVEHGARVNAQDKNGYTPLHHFLLGDYSPWEPSSEEILLPHHIDGVRFLLEHNALVNTKNRAVKEDDMPADTPLHLALLNNAPIEIIQLLLDAKADVNAVNSLQKAPIMYVLNNRPTDVNVALVKLFIAYGANVRTTNAEGQTPLHKAVRFAYPMSILKLLVDKGALINAQNKSGVTPLGYAISSLEYHYQDMIDFLLFHGADIRIKDYGNNSLLHRAARYNNIVHIPMLIEQGFDINEQNKDGNTPLHIATKDSALLLLQAGADITILNKNGESAWFSRFAKGPLVKEALERAFNNLSTEQQKLLTFQEELFRRKYTGYEIKFIPKLLSEKRWYELIEPFYG